MLGLMPALEEPTPPLPRQRKPLKVRTLHVRTHQALVRDRHEWAQTLDTNFDNRAVKIEDDFDGRGFTVTNEVGQEIHLRISDKW
jgi:hypothetical protein